MQCPLCGRSVTELDGGVCDRCLSERKRFVELPGFVDATTCAHCGKTQRAGLWRTAPPDREALARESVNQALDLDPDLADHEIHLDAAWEDERNALVTGRVTGRFRDEPVERPFQTRLRLKTSVCTECSREFGGYFEAIIQVRGGDPGRLEGDRDRMARRIESEMARYRSEERPGAYFSRSERVRGGIDYYVGSLEVARLLAHGLAERYGADYAEASKLVGRRDGRDLHRFTLRVRMPPYAPGDFLLVGGRPFKVLRHERKRLTLWDLERNEVAHREPRRLRDLKVIGRASDEKDAVVVSLHQRRLQLLDPANLRATEIDVEAGFQAGESVRVFRHEERLYLIPLSARVPER